MAEFSYPFDTGNGASVTQEMWSRMAKYWQRPGVPYGVDGTNLKVTATNASGLTVQVAPGEAGLLGYFYYSDAPITVTHAPNSSGNPRIDTIVLRLDWNADRLYVVTSPDPGTPAASPSPNLIVGDYDNAGLSNRVFEIPLAYVRVETGASTITSDKITDMRAPGSVDVTSGTFDTRPDWSDRFRPPGSIHYEADTGRWVAWNGGAWTVMHETGGYTDFAATVWAGSTDYSDSFAISARYRVLSDRSVHYWGFIQSLDTFTNSPTAYVRVGLPALAADYGEGSQQLAEMLWRPTSDSLWTHCQGMINPRSDRIGTVAVQTANADYDWLVVSDLTPGARLHWNVTYQTIDPFAV